MLLHNYPSGVADQKDTLYKKPSDLFMITVMKRFVEIASIRKLVTVNPQTTREGGGGKMKLNNTDLITMVFACFVTLCLGLFPFSDLELNKRHDDHALV